MSRSIRLTRGILGTPRAKALAGVLAATAVVAASSSAPVWAGESNDGVDVVNTETVQVYADADGHLKSKRLYEQLSLSGHGKVRLENPVSKDGLRNLDGFGGFDVKNGVEYVNATVDGEKALRSLNTYKGDLPLKVSIAYTLDGKKVSANDVVGKSGHLQVRYTVENVSSEDRQISYPDGRGGTLTKTVQVPIPIVGSLGLVAPSSFRNVTSAEANLAGDGKGGTRLSFTMTLFPPIGSTKAEFGYEADITDGVIPRVDVSALPIDPLASPTFKSAANSYQSGADTGVDLTAGAAEIDGNLLKLRDGAADLLAGLLQLHEGADQLSAGLNGDAAPGAKKLAAGLGQAHDGSKQLSSGAAQLADGQESLANGLKQLKKGVEELPAALESQLATNAEYETLLVTLDKLVSAIGDKDSKTASTLMGGLKLMAEGLRTSADVDDCGKALIKQKPERCGIGDAAEFMAGQLGGKPQELTCASLILADLASSDAANNAPDTCFPLGNVRPALSDLAGADQAVLGAISHQLATGATQLTGLIGGLQGVVAGVDGTSDTVGLAQAVMAVRKGLFNAPCNPAAKNSVAADFCGLSQAITLIRKGVPTLVAGISENVSQTLLTNIGTGARGCNPTKTLLCGATTLAAGASQLEDGAGDLDDGLGQLDTGAGTLADGLVDAADGSSQIADGLADAAEGAPQIVDGAGRLSTEGTSQLVAAGESTAQSYGEMVAIIKAGGERAQTESMVYGAPKDAIGLAAYSYVIEGADGSGGRNLDRGLLAGGLLVIGGGAALLRRRFL